MNSALIVNGTVLAVSAAFVDTGATITTSDAIFPKSVITGYSLVPCTSDVSAGYTYNGTVFTPPAPLAPPVPQSVTRFQALAALSNAGLLTAAQNAVNTSTNPLVSLAWNNAQTFDRTSPTIASLAGTMGLTSAQIDSLFIAAAQIKA